MLVSILGTVLEKWRRLVQYLIDGRPATCRASEALELFLGANWRHTRILTNWLPDKKV